MWKSWLTIRISKTSGREDGESKRYGKNNVPHCMFVIVSVCARSPPPPVAFAIIILRPGAHSMKLECLRHLGGLMEFGT